MFFIRLQTELELSSGAAAPAAARSVSARPCLGALFNQVVHNAVVTECTGCVQSGAAIRIRDVKICAEIDSQFHRFQGEGLAFTALEFNPRFDSDDADGRHESSRGLFL